MGIRRHSMKNRKPSKMIRKRSKRGKNIKNLEKGYIIN